MYCNKMVSTPILISSTSLSHSLYYRSILGSTFKKKDFLAPQCFVFYISTQYSIKNAYIYSMESIKSYFLHTTRVHLLPLITYLYLYHKITKISILLILMTFSIHKDLVIMSHSWFNMHKLLCVFYEETFSMAAIAVSVLYSFISSALIANSNTMLHHFDAWSITLFANSLSFMWLSFTLQTDNLFIIFKPLN